MRPVTAIGPEDVLLIVDVQNDFVSGTMAIPGAEAIIPVINRLVEGFAHVVLATDWHPRDHISFASKHPGRQHGDVVEAAYGPQRVYRDHCVQGRPGAELDPRLEVTKAELVLRKGYRPGVESNGAFYENDGVTATGLGAYLRARGLGRVFCTGLARYGCVKASAEGAVRDGFEVFMIDDACKGRDLGDEADRRAAEELQRLGVRRLTSGELLAAAARAA